MKSQPKRAFHIASEPEIKAGEVSDVYFDRTVEILRARGLDKRVKAEIRLKSFPQPDWTFGVLAGIWPSHGTQETLRHFAAQGIATVDISTDQKDQRNLIPYDGHPSAFANEQSADKLSATLK